MANFSVSLATQLSKKASIHSFIHFVNMYSTSSIDNFKKCILNCKRNRLPTTQFASFINSKFASYSSDFCSNQLGSSVICCEVKENMRQKYLSLRVCCVFTFNISIWVLPKALMERIFLMVLLFIYFSSGTDQKRSRPIWFPLCLMFWKWTRQPNQRIRVDIFGNRVRSLIPTSFAWLEEWLDFQSRWKRDGRFHQIYFPGSSRRSWFFQTKAMQTLKTTQTLGSLRSYDNCCNENITLK